MPASYVVNPLEGHTRFRKLKDLNSGSFGFVCLALDTASGEEVAIKFLPLAPPLSENVEREILNHRTLLHHHVIQFKGVFLTTDHLGIVLEYAPGGDLLEWIQKRKGVEEAMGRWLFQQLVIGLDYIHHMGVANRDIKLENTLVDDGEWPLLKICDFGYSKNSDVGSAAKSLVGTRPYLAPEVISQTRNSKQYDGKLADIWSSGVFLYVMLLGAYPFSDHPSKGMTSDAEIMRRIQQVEYDIPAGVISTECEDLIRKILVKDPQERPSIKDIQAHPWYQDNLPEGATDLTDFLNLQVEGLQPVEDIKKIIETARAEGKSRL